MSCSMWKNHSIGTDPPLSSLSNDSFQGTRFPYWDTFGVFECPVVRTGYHHYPVLRRSVISGSYPISPPIPVSSWSLITVNLLPVKQTLLLCTLTQYVVFCVFVLHWVCPLTLSHFPFCHGKVALYYIATPQILNQFVCQWSYFFGYS